MSVRSLNGLNSSTTNVYVNTNLTATLPLEENQSSFNNPIVISLKGITGFTGSAGNVLKSNATNNELEWGADAGSNWNLTGTNLTPLATTTTISIGSATNSNGYGVYVLDKNIAIKTSSGSSSSQGLRIINDTYSVLNYLDNTGDMFWAGAQNDYNFDKKIIINTSGSANELSNGTYNYTLPTTAGGTLALTTDIPTPTTQYWSLTGNLLEPVSTYDLQIDGFIKIGSSTENYILQTDDTDHTFQIKEQDGTNVFKYDSDNGYVDFGTIAGSRMNFGYYTLHGIDTDYPSGVNMPFGTISSIYGASAFIRSITTDDLILSEYGASPATITTTLRCNSLGDVAFTRGANFSNKVVINTSASGNELSNGTYNYTLPTTGSGTLALTTDIPTPTTQYWSLTGNLLEPTSTYDLQIDGVIKIGTSTENYVLQMDDFDHTFQIKEQDGTNVFKYDSDNGYVDFGTIVSARMNFGNYILHGENTAYPKGVSMPFGTVHGLYVDATYSRIITTDEITLAEYGGNPSTINTTLRCNSLGDVAFQRGANFSNQVVINTGTGLGLELSNGNYEYSFPTLDGTLALFSQIPTNNNQLINGSGFITQASTDTLTNKTIISFTANAGAVITTPSSTGTLALTTDLTGFITASSTDTLTNKTWNSSPIGTAYGGVGFNTYTKGDLIFASATNTLSKLALGSVGGQVLTVNSLTGVPVWTTPPTPDSTLETNFGTAVITGGTIKLGTTVTGYSSNLELYFNSTLKFFNTSNVNVATFTVSSSWVNLDLKGGTISNVYIGTNGIWNGDKIEYNYGGTGLSTLTPNKILQINSSGNGYNMIDLPISNTYTAGTDISISSLNVISYTGSGGSLWTETTGTLGILEPTTPAYKSFSISNSGPILSGAQTYILSTDLTCDANYNTFNCITTTINPITNLTVNINTSPRFNVNSTGAQITGNLEMTGTGIVYTNSIKAYNNGANQINYGSYGWDMYGSNPLYMLALRNPSYSNYPLLGNLNGGFQLHINGVGNAMTVNTAGTVALCVATTERLTLTSDTAAFSTSYVFNRANIPGDQLGFTTYLNPNYVNNTYAVLGSDSPYVFISTGQTSGFSSRTGGVYVGYFSSGGWNYVSDRKFKIDIHTLENSLDKINAIRGVSFYWNELSGKPMDDKQVGFIAQEINEIVPEICDYNTKTESWAVDYAKLTPVIVEAIKEQQIEIDTLKIENETLKTELDTVKTELDTYKSLMDKLINAPSFKSFKESIA